MDDIAPVKNKEGDDIVKYLEKTGLMNTGYSIIRKRHGFRRRKSTRKTSAISKRRNSARMKRRNFLSELRKPNDPMDLENNTTMKKTTRRRNVKSKHSARRNSVRSKRRKMLSKRRKLNDPMDLE